MVTCQFFPGLTIIGRLSLNEGVRRVMNMQIRHSCWPLMSICRTGLTVQAPFYTQLATIHLLNEYQIYPYIYLFLHRKYK